MGTNISMMIIELSNYENRYSHKGEMRKDGKPHTIFIKTDENRTECNTSWTFVLLISTFQRIYLCQKRAE